MSLRTTQPSPRFPCAALILVASLRAGTWTCAATDLTLQIDAIDVADVPEVEAYVTVLDARGEAVKGLKRQSFAMTERPVHGGDSHEIGDFTAKSVLEGGHHLAIAIVVDRSGSMKGKPLEAARQAVTEFLGRLSDDDQVVLVSFATSVRTDCPLSTDRSRLSAALKRIRAEGDTALYDAAQSAVQTVASAPDAARKAVVLLTDGQRTTGSLATADPVTEAAVEARVRLFTVGLGHEPEQAVLEELSSSTGGAYFPAASPHDLLAIYQKIADRLQNQYILAFHRPREPQFHELTVRAVYGTQSAQASMKFRPVPAAEGPPEEAGGTQTVPDTPVAPPTPPTPAVKLKVLVAAIWGLAVATLIAILVVLRRRR